MNTTTNNKVILIGHLGADPEGFDTKRGQAARFRMATSTTYTDGDGVEKAITDWHRVVVFGAAAKEALGFRKGGLVEIEGRLQTRSYTDKSNVKRYETSVVAERIVAKGAELAKASA